jgi:hypothetical protein
MYAERYHNAGQVQPVEGPNNVAMSDKHVNDPHVQLTAQA